MSFQLFKRQKPKNSISKTPMPVTGAGDRQDGSIITTLPTELLLQIFSYLFCLRPDETLHHRLFYSSAGSPSAVESYKSVRRTCKRFRDVVSSEQAMTFHLGDTAVLSLLKEKVMHNFTNLEAISDARARTIKYLNINCRPEPVYNRNSGTGETGDEKNHQKEDLKKVLSTGLDILRKTHSFVNIKIVEIVFRFLPSGTGAYFGTEESGGHYTFPVLSADLGREILTAFIPAAAKLENLRQLLFRQFTPTACPGCQTEEWHTVLKRLTDFSLRFYKHHHVSEFRVSEFAEQFGQHWLPHLFNLRSLDLWLTGDLTDHIVGSALTGGSVTMPRLFNFSQLDCFSCGQIACEEHVMTFLWQHRTDIKRVLIGWREFGVHNGPPVFPDWVEEEWPIVERAKGTIFRRRETSG